MNYYKELELERTASISEIRQRYRQLSKRYHPDANGSTAQMVRLNIIYDVLTHELSRSAYDETLSDIQNDTEKQTSRSPATGQQPISSNYFCYSSMTRRFRPARARSIPRKRPEYWVWLSAQR